MGRPHLTPEMININARIEASRNHVLSENEIEQNMGGASEIIKAGCQTNFQTVGRQGKTKSCIQEWLGLGSDVNQENLVDELSTIFFTLFPKMSAILLLLGQHAPAAQTERA